jgi:hypothetical protein
LFSDGGVPAKNAKGERLLLYLGVIDILQSYRLFKKLEHTWKSVLHDGVSFWVEIFGNKICRILGDNFRHQSGILCVPLHFVHFRNSVSKGTR